MCATSPVIPDGQHGRADAHLASACPRASVIPGLASDIRAGYNAQASHSLEPISAGMCAVGSESAYRPRGYGSRHLSVVQETRMSTDERTLDQRDQQDAHETAHILIGDDDAHIRDILRQDLEENGYSIVEARTGPEALEALIHDEPRPELALLDVRMPEVEGTDILQRMQI